MKIAIYFVACILLLAASPTPREYSIVNQAEEILNLDFTVFVPEGNRPAVSVDVTKILFANGDFVVCTPEKGKLYPYTWLPNTETLPYDCSAEVVLNEREVQTYGNQSFEVVYKNVWWVVVDGRLSECDGDSVYPLNPTNCSPDYSVGDSVYVLWTANAAICNVGGQIVEDWRTGQWVRYYGGLTLYFDSISPYSDTPCNRPQGYGLSEIRLLLVGGRETVCDDVVIPSFPELTRCRPDMFVMDDSLYR